MKPKIISILFLSLLFLSGCKTSEVKKSAKEQLFSPGDRHKVCLAVEENQTQGEIFFSEGGVLHFLHTDSTSPLFGMEEVFYKDRHVTLFQGMQYESTREERGSALLFPLFHTLRAKEPKGVKKEENKKTLHFEEENLHLAALLDQNGALLSVKGDVCGFDTEITFLSNA